MQATLRAAIHETLMAKPEVSGVIRIFSGLKDRCYDKSKLARLVRQLTRHDKRLRSQLLFELDRMFEIGCPGAGPLGTNGVPRP